MSGRLMGYGHRAPRVARRRLITFAVLLGISLVLFAASGTAPVRSLQAGLNFAFAPALETVNGIGNQVRSVGAAIGEIDRLRTENATLSAENERLATENRRLAALGPENAQLSALLQIRNSYQFEMVASRVIARDVVDVRRVVTIDKGSRDGLEEGDVVVADGGALAGRITEIGEESARVTLISDPASVVIGQVVGSKATGEIRGDLGGTLVMDKIDATRRLTVGDEVITAGIVLADGIRSPYPRGLVVGSVEDASRDPNAIVQTAYLQPAADLDRLEVVLVITDYSGGIPVPSPTPDPSAQPAATPEPSATPAPTPEPTPTPKPSARAGRTPRPSAGATPKPTRSP